MWSIVTVLSSRNKEFHQWCFETRTAKSSDPVCWSLLSCNNNMITNICCVPTLFFTVFDGWCYPLIRNKWITFSSICKIFLKRYFATPPKLAGRSLWRWRKNVASIIWTSISSGVVRAPFISSYVKNADFGVCNIVPSTWLKDKRTAVEGNFSIWVISTFLSHVYEVPPNKSRIKHADKSFLSDAVIFCFPVSVANEIIFWLLSGFSNRRESCEHSSIHVFRSFYPFLNTFIK